MTDPGRLAAAWAEAVRGTSFVPLRLGELRSLLHRLTRDLVAAAEGADPASAEKVGRALVEAHFTNPESLRRTIVVIGDQVPGAVVAALAAGYAQALQDRTLLEQERITSAAVTALREAQAAEWQTQARYRAVFAEAHFGISLADVDGRILDVNNTLCRLFGYSPGEFRGRDFTLFTHPSDDPAIWQRVADMVAGRVDRIRTDKAYYRADGTEIWTDLVLTLIRDVDGAPSVIVAMLEDVTERRRLEGRLRHQAGHDPLTDLPNRATFYSRLAADLAAGRPVGVCYLDLDGFKEVNDTLGHGAGDALLRVVARRLRTGADPALVARMGGDEFIVLVRDEDAARTEEVARRVLDVIREPVEIDGHIVTVSASAGVATSACPVVRDVQRDPADPAAELLTAADTTLLWAKGDGRDRCAVYDPHRHRAELAREELAAAIPEALRTGAIEPHFQLLIRLSDGRPCGAEALARWRRPDGTFRSPAEFVRLAEEHGTVGALGQHLLRTACTHAVSLCLPDPFVLSVNVSAQQVHDPDFEAQVMDVLDGSGWPAAALQLELTESDLMETGGRPLQALTALAGRGVSIAIDDFGTGYSNLAYLHSLPVTVVKLAGPFVGDPVNTGLLDAVITMAHALGLGVTAEEIETAEQARVLRDLGCDTGQGFFFSRVHPPHELAGALGLPTAAPTSG
jgi:diguanylate cyclase (GGDEF)-like protein/PAS domain S-box-containing protein